MNNSYFNLIDAEDPPEKCFYNPGSKSDGFKNASYFYRYFDENDKLINKEYSFSTDKTQTTTETISDNPEHIQKYNDITVRVHYKPLSALNDDYDGNQLKIDYLSIPTNNMISGNLATEQVYDSYAPPGYKASRFVSTAWSKNYPYLYVNILYSHSNQYGFSNILKIDISKKTIEQTLPRDGNTPYHPYPISLGKVEAILYLDRSQLKIAINMNSVPNPNHQQDITTDDQD